MFCGVQGKPICFLGKLRRSWVPTLCIGRNSAPETFFVRHCAPGIWENGCTYRKMLGETVSRRSPLRDTQTPRAYMNTRISFPICPNRLLL